MPDVHAIICPLHLFYFRLWSVSLDGGNPTVLDTWGYDYSTIIDIAVLHEECGKSGKNSNENPSSARKTSVCTSIVYELRNYVMLSFTTLTVNALSHTCKGSFYIAQYPVRWIAQSALHLLPPLADLFIPTPTRLLREAF